MDRLKMPAIRAGACVDRDDRVSERVVTGAVAAVVIGRWAGDRQISDCALGVDRRRECPHVGAAAILPAVAPRFVKWLAGTRNGLELPQLRAGPHVERARVARGPLRHLAARRTDDRDVLEDRWCAAVGDTDVDCAVRAEARGRRAGRRIERDQIGAAHEQDARRRGAVTGPITDAARRRRRAAAARACRGRCCARRRRRRRQDVFPHERAAVAIECDDAIAARQIHHAADDDGHGRRVAAELVRPARGECCDVRRRNLGQRRVAIRVQVTIDQRPITGSDCRRRCRRRRGGRGGIRLIGRLSASRQSESNGCADASKPKLHDRPPN